MKRKNGFTMVEILVVVAILILIIAIAVPSTISMMNKNKTNQYEKIIDTIVNAAEYYVEDKEIRKILSNCKDGIKIPLSTLANENLIKANLTNPISGDPLAGFVSATTENCGTDITYVYKDLSAGDPAPEKVVCDLGELFGGGGGSGSNQTENVKYIENIIANTPPYTVYTFKGRNPNNFVRFRMDTNSNALWRILSILSDGSLKLVYTAPIATGVTYATRYTHLDALITNNKIDANWLQEKEYAESRYPNIDATALAALPIWQYQNFVTRKISLLEVSDVNSATDIGNYLFQYDTFINVHGSVPGFNNAVGIIGGNRVYGVLSSTTHSIVPIVTLIPSVKITSGKGTETDPYILTKE